ncbi:hypothetical protein POVCU2_0012610 [Plasmodium ovale curtisi]|uniref:Uncharacterized protein n=1 Tax=Plasmodium ovale curtisi TaxID=864141 RepID=A0A1A8VNE3_PLAOA|nr:hypothetical protein POVCU2_0012610 [Plasmodium ovale curtisi]SBS84877.1 hypothetical protein POVCU1_011630 [Plasmodium ovale curtisi]
MGKLDKAQTDVSLRIWQSHLRFPLPQGWKNAQNNSDVPEIMPFPSLVNCSSISPSQNRAIVKYLIGEVTQSQNLE